MEVSSNTGTHKVPSPQVLGPQSTEPAPLLSTSSSLGTSGSVNNETWLPLNMNPAGRAEALNKAAWAFSFLVMAIWASG
jgi:hypothetical protein